MSASSSPKFTLALLNIPFSLYFLLSSQQKSLTSLTQVTEYFPIRRSERKPKGELLKEQMEGIEARLLSTDDSTLDIKISMIENKGRGIKSKRAFAKGEFIVEYAGELISDEESKAR